MAKANMQVVLRQSVEHLGKAGDIVNVRPGYARNFLFPRQLASRLTPGLLKVKAMWEQQELERKIAAKQQAESYKTALETIGRFVIHKTVGEGDALFGTVTNGDVAEAVLAASGLDIDRRNVLLDQDIKTTGVYAVEVRLHPEVTATIRLQVTPG